ncbi:MAG TPA: ATP-binding protein [Burkholderiales bacterium]|jgi:two-component system osmolarity sensor histidine kinase EnvZ|nr:ATP-binding protein [Burkholderiales bacterium]
MRLHWLPQSLLSRSMLLIAALLVVSQLIWFGLYRTYNVRTQSEYLATQIASVLATVSAALETMPAASRRRFSEKLPSQHNIRLLPATAWENGEVALPESPLLRAIGAELKRQLGSDAEALVMLEDATRALWIKIQVRNQAYWVVFPPGSRGSASVWAWAGWSFFGLTLAIVGAYVLMLRVNRPLRALTEAAEHVGAGKSPPPLPETGPIEIRTLSRAFNRMSENLKQLDQERAVLLAGISHDLRTPLSRLRLGVEMLRENDNDPLREGMIRDIEDMDAIINQFLDFARDGGEEPMRCGEDLNQIVASICSRYARMGRPIRARLQPLPPMMLKPTATQRMVTNLVDNAARYGNGEIEVRTEREGDKAIVRVLDRGPGIPQEEVQRVMRPFTRLEASRGGGTGSGLGLAIVERAARLHGGEVRLLARAGGGLEARLELPIEQKAA